MKKLTVEDLKITVRATPCEDDAYSDLGECMTKKQIKNLLTRAESNVWEWCDIEVKASYKGLSASEYLGASSYKSEADFIKSSDYYTEMVDTVLSEIQQQAEEIAAELQD